MMVNEIKIETRETKPLKVSQKNSVASLEKNSSNGGRLIGESKSCLICGTDRVLEIAHLANGFDIRRSAKRKRFEPYIYLCPNHHRLYDTKRLTVEEVNKLPPDFRQYYEAQSVATKSRILSRAIKKKKKRSRQLAKPHIRPHHVNGSVFYSYCRGTDKEIYLGSADFILEAVKAAKRVE